MIITKEHQESWVNAYVKEKHTTDECSGFIDGIEKALNFVQEKMKPTQKQKLEEYKLKLIQTTLQLIHSKGNLKYNL